MIETIAAAPHDRPADIAKALEEEIVLGLLQPREHLIEEEIAARFAAKRHLVRAAIFELARLGLVDRQTNRGAFVRVLDSENVRHIYDVRIALECLAAERIPLPAPAQVIGDLRAIQTLHEAAVRARDPRGAFRANMRFHATLFAACGNPHLVELIRLSAQKVHGVRSLTAMDPHYLQRSCDEHWAIIAALQGGDRAALVHLCESHILPSRDVYIAQAQARAGPGDPL